MFIRREKMPKFGEIYIAADIFCKTNASVIYYAKSTKMQITRL